MKYGIDSRFALYADRLPAYLKVRKALATQNPEDWQDYFSEHQLDQVVVVNFFKAQPPFWWDTERWRQRDGTRARWSFPGPARQFGRDKSWPPNEDDAWNRKAFGPVPTESRPPAGGP